MGKLDVQVFELFQALKEEADKLGIERISSVMVLKALLEWVDSPIYDAIFTDQIEAYGYPEMLNECYDQYTRLLDFKQFLDKEERSEAEAEGREVIYPTITCKTQDGLTEEFVFDEDMNEIIRTIYKSKAQIGIYELSGILVHYMPAEVLKILRTFGVNIKLLKEYFNKNRVQNIELEVFEVPENLKSFVTDLNKKFSGQKCDISGRDKECELVWQTLQKRTKRNVILIGEPGVGKTSIVEKITSDILSGDCPEEFKNAKVLLLDVNSSIAGTMYRGQSEERYAQLAEFLESASNVILFIDEIHLIRGAGACKEGEADLSNALKPILAGNKVRVIGATTYEEYENYFSKDGAIKRRFRPIEVKEPKNNEVYPMLKKSIETLSQYHGVTISKEMIDFVILNSACFNYETKNPDRTKDLIDLSMVVAKQHGKKQVDKACVLSNFEYNIKAFSKMSRSIKRSTAYHEAGHCIMLKCSKYLKNQKVIAVSIMPTDTYLGVTVSEDREDSFADSSMNYYIDLIAMSLAGRVAESMCTGTISSGAASDLIKATKTAHAVVAKYGMTSFGKNRIFFDEVNSQEVMNHVNAEIDEIIAKAMKRAEIVIKNNKEILKTLADELLKKGILNENDLEKIFKKEKTSVAHN